MTATVLSNQGIYESTKVGARGQRRGYRRLISVSFHLPASGVDGNVVARNALDRARRQDSLLQRVSRMLGGIRIDTSPTLPDVQVDIDDLDADATCRRLCYEYLWPALHSLKPSVAPSPQEWARYDAMNERVAEAIARTYRAGDVVWVHDFPLLHVPAKVRARIAHAPIEFVLHTPVPPCEARDPAVDWKRVWGGLLAADVVVTQTSADEENLSRSLAAVGGRTAQFDAHPRIFTRPAGIDCAWFGGMANRSETIAAARTIRGTRRPLFVAIDCEDWPSNILTRLRAFERLLEFEPGLRGRARFLQIVIDSPRGSTEPPELKNGIANRAAEINARHGTDVWRPVELRFDSLTREDLVVVYRAADVMVAAPISDLTPFAKEFIASRADGSGALVLRRGAGPAPPPRGAVVVDGDDEFSVFLGLRHAAAMTRGEEDRRMRRLRSCVTAHDVVAWARGCLEVLESPTASAAPGPSMRD